MRRFPILLFLIVFAQGTASAAGYYYGIGFGRGIYSQSNSNEFLFGDSKLIVGRYLWPFLAVEAQLGLPGSTDGIINVVNVNMTVDNYLAVNLRGKYPLGHNRRGKERLAVVGFLGFTRMQTMVRDSSSSSSGLEYSQTYGAGLEAPLTSNSTIAMEYIKNVTGSRLGVSYQYTTFSSSIRISF